MAHNATDKWRDDLATWAIPKSILDQAPEKPWIHPPALFEIPDVIPDSISHQRAREVIQDGGSILDIGCGGGVASFAVTPPATLVIGVDEQQAMLDLYEANARKFGVAYETHLGLWPAVEGSVPRADVVAVHHVAFNVGDIAPFLLALNNHARKRVVLEVPEVHPMTNMNEGWKHFWNIDRPTVPHASDLIDVLHELGIEAHIEYFENEFLLDKKTSDANANIRRRLCLDESRQDEVDAFISEHPLPDRRKLTTIWWDVAV